MNYRTDKYGNALSILGFGCLRFPQKHGRIDMEETEREILLAIEQGVNYFDTAYIYTGSEAALGEILEKNGLLNQFLLGLGLVQKPLSILNTETAVIIGMIHLLIPYMILSLVGVLQSIDPNVEYAAYSLGANPAETFCKVIFPLSLPGIISGCVMVFTMSMTSYVTPKLLGGSKFRMMATMVVQEINVSFDWGAASAISYILLAVILLIQVLVVLSTAGYMKRLGGGKNA